MAAPASLQYYTMIFGIFEMTARGDMTVIENSSVSIGSNLAVGSTGRGSLTVSGGSTVDVLGDPLAFGTSRDSGCFSVGTFAGSNGSAIVSDPGSELNSAVCIVVGGGGNDPGGFGNAGLPGRGSFDIVNGASATTLFLNAGLRETGVGTVNIVDSTLNILGTDDNDAGAFMTVARSARGRVTAKGSNILIDPEDVISEFDLGAGFNVNRDATGRGALNLKNGSTLRVKGAFGFGGIGRRGGSSRVNIRTGSSLIIEDRNTGAVWVHPEPNSTARISVTGKNSLLDAGNLLSLGLDFNGLPVLQPAGRRKLRCDLKIGKRATVRAVTIRVGPGCTIRGRGTIVGTVVVDPKATISSKITIIP